MKRIVLMMMVIVFVSCSLNAQQRDTVYSNDWNKPNGFIGLSAKGDSIFRNEQVEAAFPGGSKEWTKYIVKNLNTDISTSIPVPPGKRFGRLTVVVDFLVNKQGKISEVSVENAGSFPDKFVKEAIRVISKSPDWIPAFQNGHNVSYKARQQISWINQPN